MIDAIDTYADARTDIGSWHREVRARGRPVVPVRQTLTLLIDHGSATSKLDCLSCWGATLGGVIDPVRSALGITAAGNLIWAAGEHVTVSQIADAPLGAQVVRAVELDINPAWVAGCLCGHRGGKGPLAPVPVVAGRRGSPEVPRPLEPRLLHDRRTIRESLGATEHPSTRRPIRGKRPAALRGLSPQSSP